MTTVDYETTEQQVDEWRKDVEQMAAGFLGITGKIMTEAHYGGYLWRYDDEYGWRAVEKDTKRNRNRRD